MDQTLGGSAIRIAEALERIAAADERRNELLVVDAEQRRRMWNEDRADRAELRRQAFGVEEPVEDPNAR